MAVSYESLKNVFEDSVAALDVAGEECYVRAGIIEPQETRVLNRARLEQHYAPLQCVRFTPQSSCRIVPFIHEWLADPTRRRVCDIVCTPGVGPQNTLNLWPGLRAQKIGHCDQMNIARLAPLMSQVITQLLGVPDSSEFVRFMAGAAKAEGPAVLILTGGCRYVHLFVCLIDWFSTCNLTLSLFLVTVRHKHSCYTLSGYRSSGTTSSGIRIVTRKTLHMPARRCSGSTPTQRRRWFQRSRKCLQTESQ